MSEARCRKDVHERSCGRCERCGKAGHEVHHRKLRSRGGGWDTANCVLLCSTCHRWVTVNPALARKDGWEVSRTQDPESVPVLLVGMFAPTPRWTFLRRDGTQQWAVEEALSQRFE